MTIAEPLSDPEVPGLEILLGEGAGPLLAGFADLAGDRVRSHRVSQIRYIPGRSVTVQYLADTIDSHGKPGKSTYVASTITDAPDDVPIFRAGDVEVSVWQFPNDPYLPGLASATDADQARKVLSQVGAEESQISLRTHSYRPMRRAVVEARGDAHRAFIKVTRPSEISRLQSIHVRLSESVPVPRSYGWDRQLGVVVMQAMPGRTLRRALERRSTSLPSAAQVISLLEMLPPPDESDRVIAGPIARASDHARLLSIVDPESSQQLGPMLEALDSVEVEPTTAAHGDFHSAQILVDKGQVVGLLDVDTVGVGERADDVAGLLGHLSTLALTSPARRDIERYGSKLIRGFDTAVDPVGLRLRVAGVVLGLATGPFRVQERNWREATRARVRLASDWIEASSSIRA